MTQKTKGLLSAQVTLDSGKIDQLRAVEKYLPPTIKILDKTETAGPYNQNCMTFNITYGPVWGGWRSDIKSHFTRACIKAGTKASVSIDRYARKVVETRE